MKIRLIAVLLGSLISLPALAQRSFDLGSVLEAGKNLAQSESMGNMTEQQEISIGRDVTASTLGAYPLIRDEALQRKLNTVGLWIALQSTRPTLPWRFAAVESNAINAFAAPGGTVMITRGMLNAVSNEAELACVIGHEVGHITRKHHLTVLQNTLRTHGIANLAVAATSSSSQNAELKKMVLNEGKEIFSKGLDRSAESEADSDGVLLAAKAGYDPGACLIFMQRLAAMKGDSNALAGLYKTHPAAADRATDIEADLKKLKGAAPGEGARPAFAMSSGNGKKKN
ncbi:MAG TPA: M48 family metalloprotease [Rhodocyclaceae bacterium]|nr:M48 family metalloprotease [Rhodocyclaceae bacterium]